MLARQITIIYTQCVSPVTAHDGLNWTFSKAMTSYMYTNHRISLVVSSGYFRTLTIDAWGELSVFANQTLSKNSSIFQLRTRFKLQLFGISRGQLKLVLSIENRGSKNNTLNNKLKKFAMGRASFQNLIHRCCMPCLKSP